MLVDRGVKLVVTAKRGAMLKRKFDVECGAARQYSIVNQVLLSRSWPYKAWFGLINGRTSIHLLPVFCHCGPLTT